MHATLEKFGYPDLLLKEYSHWAVLLRPAQVTLGSCVICIKDDIRHVGAVGAAAFAEYAQVTANLERALQDAFTYDKINYLLFMMVDPQVHYHVLPRYASARSCSDQKFTDTQYPQPTTLKPTLDLTAAQLAELQQHILSHWPV